MKPHSKSGSAPVNTIRQIAKAAGVSIATVSRVLNNPESVKPDKRAAVMRVVEQNDYINDGMAKSLAGGRTHTIGLVIPTITNSIYASSTQAIERLAQKSGYSVIFVVSDFDREKEEHLIRRLVERRVDGIILTGGEHDPRVFRTLERHNIPCVLTWRRSESAVHPSVSFDNYAAGLLAMKKLISLGHQRIGLICGRTDVNDRAEKRWRAYVDALTAIDVEVDARLVFERDFEFIEGHTAMIRMLDNPDPPTAVFAANDIQAIGALQGCRERGLSVPDDISIIGFDDLPIAQFSYPKLTTIHVPAADMGHLAATRLFQQIDGETVTGSDILPVKLVERDSVAPPRQRE